MYLTIAHLDFISPTSKSKILRKWDTLGNLLKCKYVIRKQATEIARLSIFEGLYALSP